MKSTHHTYLINGIAALLMLATSASALADRDRGHRRGAPDFYNDEARVVSSRPVYEEINEPRKECWTERVGHTYETTGERSYGGAILGGIVGGIVGNQVGKGKGKTVATAVGAATGAIVGDRIDNDGANAQGYSQPREYERCRSVDHWTRRVTGYDVVYRYHGREYSEFLPYDPGERVRVNVSVSIADR